MITKVWRLMPLTMSGTMSSSEPPSTDRVVVTQMALIMERAAALPMAS